MRQRRSPPIAAHTKRLEQLAAAVDAHRDGHPRRRLSRDLRTAVVDAIEAGAPVRAVGEACKVSASQITRWRQAAARSGDASALSTAASASPRVLSVVDAAPREDTLLESEIELRIGGWHVSLRRIAQ